MIELEKGGLSKVSYDFSKCMYDISTLAPGGLLKTYPELNAYEEFVNTTRDEEIKIAICLCDINSPFLKIKDFRQKLTAIFEYLSLKDKVLFEEMFTYTNETITSICSVYMQMQNNHDFTYWWNTNQLYYSLMNEMGKPRGKEEDVTRYVDRKLKIQKQAEPIKNDLLNIEANLFSDSKMKMAIAKSKLTVIRTYAEMFAESNGTE